MKENIHKGHRERMRKRYLDSKGDGFQEHELLELYLYGSIPQKDINPLAHELMNRFLTLERIMDADYDELKSVKNMTSAACIQLMLLNTIFEKSRPKAKLNARTKMTRAVVTKYFESRLWEQRREVTLVMFLNAVYELVSVEDLSEGNEREVSINVKYLAKKTTLLEAKYVILAHNHPCGNANPSNEDIYATKMIAFTLYSLDVDLLDHIIVSPKGTLSLWDLGYIANIKKDALETQKFLLFNAEHEDWYDEQS